jgi:hypothetical protein
MGSLGVRIMNSMAFSLLSKSNSKIAGNQIIFGAVDFQPHPPTLAPVFASLYQEMDLMIGSFNFRVGSLGSACISDPIKLGLSARKTTMVATQEISAGSSSGVNSAVSIEPTKGNTVEELGEILENLDQEELSGSSTIVSDEKFGNISERDFITSCSDVSGNSEDTWRSELRLHSDEQAKLHSNASQYANNRHQMYVIINDTSKEVNNENNPVINPHNLE